MAGGSGKIQKGAEYLGAADKDPETGGGQPEVIQYVLQGGSAGGVAVRVGYVGAEPPHWAGPGEFSAQGCTADHQEAAKEAGEGVMGLSTAGIIYGGGGI